jgi:hypothetical protein
MATTNAQLSSFLADGGTVTFSYPSGTTAASFPTVNGHVLKDTRNTKWFSPREFTVVFGVSNITVTYQGGETIPKGTTLTLDLDAIEDAGDAIEIDLGDGAGAVALDARLKALPINVKDFGAKGDGVTDDTAAFTAANARGGALYIPKPAVSYTFADPLSLDNVAVSVDPTATWAQITDDGKLSWPAGSFRDDDFVPIHRMPGRAFVGAASRHSGNRQGANGYGDDPISQDVVSYPIKNSAFAAIHEDPVGRIGVLGVTWVQPGSAGNSAAGVFGYGQNDGTSGMVRGIYAEGVNASSAGGAVAAEFQVGNRSANTPTVSAYDMSNGITNAIQIGAEGQDNYSKGDADTVFDDPTQPCGAAIDISGGVAGSAWQKFVGGIIFRNGALVRDGSNFAAAMKMAQKHKVVWDASAHAEGASIWSEVTASASRMALAFRNNEVTFYGPVGQTIGAFRHDAVGGTTVNNIVLRGARTATNPTLIVEGSDTNPGLDFQTKGIGITRFTSHAGSGESLRVTPPASAPTDYLTVQGSATLGLATIGTAGASTNIDIALTPKGSGYLRFGTRTASSDVAVTGYIEIRDSGGTIRRLAVVG